MKNLLSINKLIEIAGTCGNYLKNSWKCVIECLSKIDYYLSEDYLAVPISGEGSSLSHAVSGTFEVEKSNQKLLEVSLSCN